MDSACGVENGVIGTVARGGVLSVFWSGQEGGNGDMINCSFDCQFIGLVISFNILILSRV